MKCFIDLDGVLVDFMGGALRRHERTVEHWPPGEWSVWRLLGMTAEQFWAPLGSIEFWADLEPTPESRAILAQAGDLFGPEVYLATSPAQCHFCAAGKTRWVQEHLPEYARRLIISEHKHLLAAPDRLLVDDSDRNCSHFRAHYGHAVLVPRIWNSSHESAGDCEGTTIIRMWHYAHAIKNTQRNT